MKKRYVAILMVIVIVCTSVITSHWRQSQKIVTDGKVIIPQTEYDSLVSRTKKYEDIERLQRYISDNYYKEIDPEIFEEGMKKGIFQILGDPYSTFMNQKEFQAFQEATSGKFPGIGVYVTPNASRGIEIVSPIEDTPAFKAGLRSLDIITAVNGVKYTHEQMSEAISHIKGEPGTKVVLTIYRASENKEFDVEIVRAMIHIKVVKSRMLDEQTGYLRYTSFDLDSATEFKSHMDKLVSEGAKGVIIDLRNNPGGSLTECLAVADMFLPEGDILSTKGRTPGSTHVFKSTDKMYDVKLVILINGGSASASEIVTGAIKDRDRGIVVGETTFGKGLVQTYREDINKTGTKLTTSEYFTPNGTNIHGIGISPHIEVKISDEYTNATEKTDELDNQLQAAIKEMKKLLNK